MQRACAIGDCDYPHPVLAQDMGFAELRCSRSVGKGVSQQTLFVGLLGKVLGPPQVRGYGIVRIIIGGTGPVHCDWPGIWQLCLPEPPGGGIGWPGSPVWPPSGD